MDNKAEKYNFITPYAYALNNPIIFIDPDGNEVWKTTTNNSDGTRTVTMHFDIRVNNSGGFSSESVAKWSGAIASQIESSYSGKSADGKTTYIAVANMDLGGDMRNEYTMDFVSYVKIDGTSSNKLGNMDGEFGDTKSNNIQIKAPGVDNFGLYKEQTEEGVGETGAHEVGHTGDLRHDNSDKNLMKEEGPGSKLTGGQRDKFSSNVQEGKPYSDKPLDKDVKNQY